MFGALDELWQVLLWMAGLGVVLMIVGRTLDPPVRQQKRYWRAASSDPRVTEQSSSRLALHPPVDHFLTQIGTLRFVLIP
jgi:hypothetical protein